MLLPDFIHAIEAQNLLPSEADCVVLAVSGGMDSVALAKLFAVYRDQHRHNLKLVMAHLNHGLRGQASDRDEDFCKGFAAELKVEFVSRKVEVERLSKAGGVSIEKAARDARYEFLYQEYHKYNADALALGHHADDQVETILMNIQRGSGLLGLAGIPPCLEEPVRRIRPLLGITRSEIESYINSKNLSYRTDESNADTAFRRNSIRHVFIPALEKTCPSLKGDLLRIGKAAGVLWNWISPLAAEALLKATSEAREGWRILEITRLKGMRKELRAETLRLAVRKVSDISTSPLGEVHIDLMENLLQDGRSGSQLDLPGDLCAAREYDKLIISRKPSVTAPPSAAEEEYTISSLCELPLKVFACNFEGSLISTSEGRRGLGNSAYEEFFDARAVALPIRLRRVQEGDRFQPLGAPGRMLISDFFTNSKVPQNKRGKAIVVEDTRGIIWLWPHRIAQRAKLTEVTEKALHLRLHPEPE